MQPWAEVTELFWKVVRCGVTNAIDGKVVFEHKMVKYI